MSIKIIRSSKKSLGVAPVAYTSVEKICIAPSTRVPNLSLSSPKKARPFSFLSQKKPDTSFKAYSLQKKNIQNQTQKTSKLVRNIGMIQLHSLEAFSFPIITLSYICFYQ